MLSAVASICSGAAGAAGAAGDAGGAGGPDDAGAEPVDGAGFGAGDGVVGDGAVDEAAAEELASVLALTQSQLVAEVMSLRLKLRRSREAARRQVRELGEENEALRQQLRAARRSTASVAPAAPSTAAPPAPPAGGTRRVWVDDGRRPFGATVAARARVHGGANVLACRLLRGCCDAGAVDAARLHPSLRDLALTGAADRRVVLTRLPAAAEVEEAEGVRVASCAFKAPVLSVAVRPAQPRDVGGGDALLTRVIAAATFMDGSLALLAVSAVGGGGGSSEGEGKGEGQGEADVQLRVLRSAVVHSKYATRAKWSSDGAWLATASRDASVALWRCPADFAAAATATAAAAVDDDSALETTSVRFGAPVEAIEFMRRPRALAAAFCAAVAAADAADAADDADDEGDESDVLVVSVRGSTALHYVDPRSGAAVPVDMSEDGSGQSAYTVLDLAASPGGELLAAATDADQHVVFEAGTSTVVARLTGHAAGGMSQPRLAWCARAGGNGAGGGGGGAPHLLSSSEASGAIHAWSLATGREVARLDAHKAKVRDLQWCADGTVLSASYDHSVARWHAP